MKSGGPTAPKRYPNFLGEEEKDSLIKGCSLTRALGLTTSGKPISISSLTPKSQDIQSVFSAMEPRGSMLPSSRDNWKTEYTSSTYNPIFLVWQSVLIKFAVLATSFFVGNAFKEGYEKNMQGHTKTTEKKKEKTQQKKTSTSPVKEDSNLRELHSSFMFVNIGIFSNRN